MSKERKYYSARSKILHGAHEQIFSALPNQVLSNLRRPGSENALLWNIIYPLAQPALSLGDLLAIRPLWGTVELHFSDESVFPYYWGFHVSGKKLEKLDVVLDRIDGDGPQTEVDLFLIGESNLVMIEAKHLSGLGRCSRYSRGRCPEIHRIEGKILEPCRYWKAGEQAFQRLLNFGPPPQPGDRSPPCNRHYQLARTLLVGTTLAKELKRTPHIWLFITRKRWRSFEKIWLDFVDRVRDDALWRCLRVMAWEDVSSLS